MSALNSDSGFGLFDREKLVRSLKENDVDMEHLQDLSDLPRSLIVKCVPASVYSDPDVKHDFEQLFRQVDSNATFEYFKTFKRCRVNFTTSDLATVARIQCNKVNFMGREIKCFFAQILDVSTNPDAAHLQLPALEKQFLISPPASPPVGWEPSKEGHPVIDFELISRLAALATDEDIHEIQPASDSYPSIIVHTCKEHDEEESLPSSKQKFIPTMRPQDSGVMNRKNSLDIETKVHMLTLEAERELTSSEKLIGVCHECGNSVTDAIDGCYAMERLYHSSCLLCVACGRSLRGKTFYDVGSQIFCEEDYFYAGFQQSAERCACCHHLIVESILKATGKSFHPNCFRCTVCGLCLDGIPFSVDKNSNVYCIVHYYKEFAVHCNACGEPINPNEDREDVRIVSMNNKDYHVDCYVCEGCGYQLTDEIGRLCYPIDGHLLCKACHVHWARTGGSAKPITDL